MAWLEVGVLFVAESPHMKTVEVAYPHIVRKDEEPARLFRDAIPAIYFPRGGYDTKPLQDGIYQIDFAENGVTAQAQAAY